MCALGKRSHEVFNKSSSAVHPDVYLLTGDLTDSGGIESYEDLASMFAAELFAGAEVIYLPGNHDNRPNFRQGLLRLERSDAPINQVHWRDGLRIISLNSTVPGEAYGRSNVSTLEFLSHELTSPAPDGTLVALHPPPVHTPIEPMARIGLRKPDALRLAIAGSDVRRILGGHNHHELAGMLGTVPVWGSPAIAYRADTNRTDVFVQLPGSAFTRVDLSDRGWTTSVDLV